MGVHQFESTPAGKSMSLLHRLQAARTAQRDLRALQHALQTSPYPALRPPRTIRAGLLTTLLNPARQAFRLYEVFVLHAAIQALARHFQTQGWEPRFPPETDVFLDDPYFRLPLPSGFGELVWQPVYPNMDGFPIRTLTHVMRPDLAVEGVRGLLILDAKYTFSPKAAIDILDDLHAYRDALIGPAGREVVSFAVAATAGPPIRSTREYYTRSFFRRSGLGLVFLPAQGTLDETLVDETLSKEPAGQPDLLTLGDALARYWSS